MKIKINNNNNRRHKHHYIYMNVFLFTVSPLLFRLDKAPFYQLIFPLKSLYKNLQSFSKFYDLMYLEV
jgi:hypothetical protein